jgi:pimeloyl-ACP methyl ester carboxylesterase
MAMAMLMPVLLRLPTQWAPYGRGVTDFRGALLPGDRVRLVSDSGFVPVDGGSLYFEAHGKGHPLLLIHAGVANLRMWDPQVPRLAERYRVIR